MQKSRIIALSLMLITAFAYAGGYQVSLHGQKQIGMGLIGTSLNMDASAAFYNPGALAMMPGSISLQAGASGIFSNITYQAEHPSLYQAKTDNPIGTPFYIYAAGMITDKLAAGIAVNTPYGNSLQWEDGWAGRFLIQDISLRAITIQPTLSYRLTDHLSVGAGLVYVLGQVDLGRALPVESSAGEGFVNIEGSTSSIGFNAGVLYASDAGINIGVSYRSRTDMEVDDGKAVFEVPASLAGLFPNSDVATMLPLPANLDIGLSYQVSPDLMIGMALNYVFWEAYENLSFTFAQNPTLDNVSPREYSNTLIARIGGQYRVNETLYFRMGAYFDPSPVNDIYFSPETPSLDNLAFTGGLSFLPGQNLSIDVSLLYIMGLEGDRTFAPASFGGTYKSRVLIPGLGISYSL
ncbi:MAG: outer membrane protein transport protein [Bacteroidales bacterium]|nr:outer membrane protein transport protein [Bacteroidales bacterium]